MRLCLQILDSQGLASGGPNTTTNDHTFVKLPVGSDRGRTQRLVCKHCSNIGAHSGGRMERKKRETAYMCSICFIPLHIDCFNAYHRVNNIEIFAINHHSTLPPATKSGKKRNRSS